MKTAARRSGTTVGQSNSTVPPNYVDNARSCLCIQNQSSRACCLNSRPRRKTVHESTQKATEGHSTQWSSCYFPMHVNCVYILIALTVALDMTFFHRTTTAGQEENKPSPKPALNHKSAAGDACTISWVISGSSVKCPRSLLTIFVNELVLQRLSAACPGARTKSGGGKASLACVRKQTRVTGPLRFVLLSGK